MITIGLFSLFSIGPIQYIKNVMDDPRYMGKFLVGGHDHYRSILLRIQVKSILLCPPLVISLPKANLV